MRDIITGNIPGFSKYYITKEGILLSRWRGEWLEIKPVIKDNGYISNNLVGDNGNRKNFYRHRLVALAWIPNPDNKPCVCHRDNNPRNNSVSNLYLGTQEDNMGQCINDKRFYFVGYYRKIPDRFVRRAIRLYLKRVPRKLILRRLGISVRSFYSILKDNHIKLNRYEKDYKTRRY